MIRVFRRGFDMRYGNGVHKRWKSGTRMTIIKIFPHIAEYMAEGKATVTSFKGTVTQARAKVRIPMYYFS